MEKFRVCIVALESMIQFAYRKKDPEMFNPNLEIGVLMKLADLWVEECRGRGVLLSKTTYK